MKVLWLIFIITSIFADVVVKREWQKGETLLSFFKKHNIPSYLYYNLDSQDKELANEIRAGVKYFAIFDKNSTLSHLLVPVNEELQIHLAREKDRYKLNFIPIYYQKMQLNFSLRIDSIPYKEILKYSNNAKLAHEFVHAFSDSLDFSRAIYKGDRLAIIYEQKIRLGEYFGIPKIKAAVVETRGKKNYIFNYEGRFYNECGKEIESFFLRSPISHAKITSRFTLRRWHPILHRYRAHLGIDFGAPRGTPIVAAGSGKIIFVGRKSGYGKVIIIAHGDGYKTLYAHLSRFKRGLRRGKYVRQGEIIGYVGSTGLSTGPHLHFGLYKNNHPINPLRVVKIAKSRLWGYKLRKFKKLVRKYKKQLRDLLKEQKSPNIYNLVQKELWCEGGSNAKG